MRRVDVDVRYLIWTQQNRAKLAIHNLEPEVVEEVLGNQPEFFVNFAGRSAEILMIGPDLSGRFYFVPLTTDMDDGGWYVVTAHRIDQKRARRHYTGLGGSADA